MLNVCSCNQGCVRIDLPRAKLHDGARARVLSSGPWKSQKVKVVTLADAAGQDVLAVTDLLHDHACSLTARSPLIGYGCDAKNMGPVPVDACANACGDAP